MNTENLIRIEEHIAKAETSLLNAKWAMVTNANYKNFFDKTVNLLGEIHSLREEINKEYT